MNVSILLRLVTDALAEGRVAGHAEVVDTGETAVFKDQDEMLAFLHRASTDQLPAQLIAAVTLPTDTPR